MKEHKIKILPHSRIFNVQQGQTLYSALVENSIFLRSDCGGRGVCGKCKVNFLENQGSVVQKNACTTQIFGDSVIDIPETALLSSHILNKPPANLPETFRNRSVTSTTNTREYGIAVDLGTTTIALYLCNMSERTVLGSLSIKNPQAIFGDDVMSRITSIANEKSNLLHLQKFAVSSIEWGCGQLTERQDLSLNDLQRMVVVGNPTMIHLLLGENPQAIGVAPYLPLFYDARSTQSGVIGFQQLKLEILTLPQLSGFIGGDIISAALAAEIQHQPPGTLLLDIGTNGELLYKGKKNYYATSCATGPAFEGASISCGIQAIPGAIERVKLSNRHEAPQVDVIPKNGMANSPVPIGLCGSGVISCTAALYQAGVIENSGKFVHDKRISRLVNSTDNLRKYVLSACNEEKQIPEISISQKDLRSIQLGKAALITGIEFLLKQDGVTLPEKIIVAGAFGSFLRKEDMVTLGMLPAIGINNIKICGNLAGAGAIMHLCDDQYLEKVNSLATQMEVIDLASNRAFQNRFVENLHFPYTSPI